MGSIYFTRDISRIMDKLIGEIVMNVAEDETLTNEQIVTMLREVRIFRKFADKVVAELMELDEKREREIAEEESRKKAEAAAAKENAEKLQESYDALFVDKTWKLGDKADGQ